MSDTSSAKKHKLPKRNPYVVAVIKKSVTRHKNRKRDSVINGEKKERNFDYD